MASVKKRVNISLPEELEKWLETESKALNMPMSTMIIAKLSEAKKASETMVTLNEMMQMVKDEKALEMIKNSGLLDKIDDY